MSNKDINIIFFGNTDFSNPTLLACNNSFNLKAVVTNKLKKMGRGQKILDTPVMTLAKEENLKIIEGVDLNDASFIDQLKDLNPDFFVVVAYRILPESLLSIPKYGSINIHSSLLPKYRGAAPIQHALLNQEDSTGVSTFLIEPKVDTGKIIDQLKIEITKNDNYGSLSKKLSEAGADLIESSINKCLHHSSELIEQDNSIATLAPKISKDDLKINWNDKSDIILAKVRAFSPTPGAFTTINSKRLKIFKAESINNDNNHEIGSIYHVDKNFFDVQCGQNALRLHSVQLEGKKAMDSKDFIVGYQDLGSNILI